MQFYIVQWTDGWVVGDEPVELPFASLLSISISTHTNSSDGNPPSTRCSRFCLYSSKENVKINASIKWKQECFSLCVSFFFSFFGGLVRDETDTRFLSFFHSHFPFRLSLGLVSFTVFILFYIKLRHSYATIHPIHSPCSRSNVSLERCLVLVHEMKNSIIAIQCY